MSLPYSMGNRYWPTTAASDAPRQDIHSACTSLLITVSHCTQRFKRVINGVVLEDVSASYGRPTTYTAIRYYGMMSYNKVYSKWLIYIGLEPKLFCSGAIISPTVFQTACHCVSEFGGRNFIKHPTINHHWERRVVIYLGVSRVSGENSMEKTTALWSVKFTVHEKCEQLGDAKIASYDYGLIEIPDDWMKTDDRIPFFWTEIEWAPLYTIKQIKDYHKYALQQQLVCLHIGFGFYNRSIYATSERLRHGWAVLQPTRTCVIETAYTERIESLVMWDCGKRFPYHRQESGAGDSGGPITCDNKFFGVMSGNMISKYENVVIDAVTSYHPLIHNLFVFAREYRLSLIDSIYHLKETFPDSDY